MEIKEESRLKFAFPDGSKVIKFDDTIFYRKFFNSLPDSKGVDFIKKLTRIPQPLQAGDELCKALP